MSVLIKGMEMPERCAMCFLRVGDCKQRIYMEQRPKACPLISIPTPHGRLGDLDELEKQFKRAIGTYLPKDPTRHMSVADGSECRGWTQALTAVQEAKTVIEAED